MSPQPQEMIKVRKFAEIRQLPRMRQWGWDFLLPVLLLGEFRAAHVHVHCIGLWLAKERYAGGWAAGRCMAMCSRAGVCIDSALQKRQYLERCVDQSQCHSDLDYELYAVEAQPQRACCLVICWKTWEMSNATIGPSLERIEISEHKTAYNLTLSQRLQDDKTTQTKLNDYAATITTRTLPISNRLQSSLFS